MTRSSGSTPVLGGKDTKGYKGEMEMANPCEFIEKRTQQRNSVHSPAIAVVRAKPSMILGQIQDISPAGLSFTYLTNILQFDEASELEILLPGEKYYLHGLSFKTVSDTVIPKENPFSVVTMSRRRVKFSRLSPLKESQITDLIKKIASPHPGIDPFRNRFHYVRSENRKPEGHDPII
jgi:hypothetical protein